MKNTLYTYRATIIQWVDGDTVDVEIDFGCRLKQVMRCRLFGIDTPEKNSKDEAERLKAKAAMDHCAGRHPVGKVVTVMTYKPDPRDKYGRWLISILSVNESDDMTNFWQYDLSRELVDLGLAVYYSGGTKKTS